MRGMIRYGFILAFICVVSAGLLSGVNAFTRSKIAASLQAEEDAGLKEVLPGANKFIAVKQDKDILYYKALDAQDKIAGFVFKAGGKGYSGAIQTLAGMFVNGRISAIKVISQNETPGLGARVTENKFTSQFNNQDSLNLSGVQAIAGATISSRAVINSVAKKAQEIKELIKNEK